MLLIAALIFILLIVFFFTNAALINGGAKKKKRKKKRKKKQKKKQKKSKGQSSSISAPIESVKILDFSAVIGPTDLFNILYNNSKDISFKKFKENHKQDIIAFIAAKGGHLLYDIIILDMANEYYRLYIDIHDEDDISIFAACMFYKVSVLLYNGAYAIYVFSFYGNTISNVDTDMKNYNNNRDMDTYFVYKDRINIPEKFINKETNFHGIPVNNLIFDILKNTCTLDNNDNLKKDMNDIKYLCYGFVKYLYLDENVKKWLKIKKNPMPSFSEFYFLLIEHVCSSGLSKAVGKFQSEEIENLKICINIYNTLKPDNTLNTNQEDIKYIFEYILLTYYFILIAIYNHTFKNKDSHNQIIIEIE
jgi:hypothetical protein